MYDLGTIAIIPLILALVQLFKMLFPIGSKWAPLVSIGLGIMLQWLTNASDGDSFKSIIILGLVNGLSASGLYSGVSAMKNGDDSPNYEGH